MPYFKYYANDKYGIPFKGEMMAENTAEVINRLKKNNILPITIKKVQTSTKKMVKRSANNRLAERKNMLYRVDKSSLGNKKRKKIVENVSLKPIKVLDVMTFTQNLYLLKKADFNNIHALEALLEGEENNNFKIIIQDILDGVQSGQNMYTIMEYYPDVFPPIYIGIIKSGELSGTLVNSLEQAREYLESSESLKQKLKSILLPNIAQFVALTILLIVGVIIAIPKVQEIYTGVGLGNRIPEGTQKLFSLFMFMGDIWYVIVGLIAAIIFIIYMYIQTPEGRYRYDMFKYNFPVFGPLVAAIDLQKFLNALRLNLENGLRLQEAIDISKEVVKNRVFLSILENCKSNLIIGEDWVEPIFQSNIFPPIVSEMLRIGMETDLAEMIGKIQEYMQKDIDRKLETTIKVLPEISYSFVGIMIVVFVIVVMVPIMEVYMGSFLFDAYL